MQFENAADAQRGVARQAAEFDAGRQVGQIAVEHVAVGSAEQGRAHTPVADGFGRRAALMRRAEGNDAAAHQIGTCGGKTAQYQSAEAVADEMQGLLMPSEKIFRRRSQGGAVLFGFLPDAVIAEGLHGQALLFQQAGKRKHGPGVHVDAVQ